MLKVHTQVKWWCLILGCLYSTVAVAVTGLDTSFGVNGRLAIELGHRNNGYAVLVQPDGKIVMAGSSGKSGDLNFSLLRFHPDGSLDPSFDGDGSVLTSLSDGDDEALALALLDDGRIIAAGYSYNGKDRDFAIICYRQDGSLDRSFGDRGVVLTAIGNGNEEITAVVVGESNTITVAGSTEGTVGRIVAVARYFINGELDRSFGEHGISLIGVGEDASAEGVLQRSDGSLVVSGSTLQQQKSSFLLVGLDRYGTLDPGFGHNGVTVAPEHFDPSEGYGLAFDDKGRIYVAGAVGSPDNRDSALFRFTPQGELDTSFGEQGAVITGMSSEDDVLYSVSVSKHEVAAGGFTTDAGTRQMLLLSYPLETEIVAETKQQPVFRIVSQDNTDDTSVQESSYKSKTRLLIRQLQMWNNRLRIHDLQISDSITSPSALVPAVKRARHGTILSSVENRPLYFRCTDGTMALRLSGYVQQISHFLLPQAMAAPGMQSNPSERETFAAPKVFSTSFSEGESVGFAVVSDRDGNILVVGTAEGVEASSMVATRFSAEELVDRITDTPGRRHRGIITTMPTKITQTSITSGGEIDAEFEKDVVGRGLVFSLHSGPVHPEIAFEGDLPASMLPAAAFAAQDSGDQVRNKAVSAGQDLSVPFTKGGHVESGEGTGTFVVQIDHLLPGSLYYLRSYARTVGGDVYYGNQLAVRTADACFIATASFGGFLHPAVGILREFRDRVLYQYSPGRWLIEVYYSFSQPVAEVIAEHTSLRWTAQVLLLPLVGFSWLALKVGLAAAVCSLLAIAVAVHWLFSRVRHGVQGSL